MALTAPYRQQNYMGEFDDDAACLIAINARDWEAAGPLPKEGMTYFDLTLKRMKFYDGTVWKLFAIV